MRSELSERLRALRASPEVARWWGPPEKGWPFEEDGVEKLVIFVDDQVNGFIQFFEEADPDHRYADIDMFISPDYQNRGLGTEAMEIALAHLFDDRGHLRVTLTTSPENERAIHVYEKLGFRRVGVLRKSERDPGTGQWRDELLMELVR